MGKRPSLAIVLTAATLAQGASATLDGVVSRGEALAGVSLASAATTAWTLKAAAHLMPSFGSKYDGFLGSIGLKR
jgi:hypothetical protein